MEQYLINLGRNLRELRKGAGLTQGELAAQLGVQQSYIAKLEGQKETRQPTLAFLLAACIYFGVGIDEIIGFNAPASQSNNDIAALSPEIRAPLEELIRQLGRKQRGDRWDTLSGTVKAVGGSVAVERGSRELGVILTPDGEPELISN